MSDPDTNEIPDTGRPASAAAPAPDVTKPHDPYAALRFRDFRVFLSGWGIAILGEQILETAVGWDVYLRTGDKAALGWIGLVIAIPVIVLALPAGHLADRFDRRRIVIAMQVMWAICALGLANVLHFHGALWTIYALLFCASIAKATAGAARLAMVPTLLPTEHFANAISWNASTFQTAAMVGPAIGGVILIYSSTAAYVTSSVCAGLFALALAMAKTHSAPASHEPATLKSLAAGVKFVAKTHIILATITLDLFAVLLGGAVYLLPIFATDILKVGSVGLGEMKAAPALGAVCMSVLVAHLPPMKHAGRAMLWAVTGFGVATIVFGLSRSMPLSLAMLFLTGAFDNISVIVRHTLVQVLTPNEMRGRVSAVNNVFIGASNELGGFESGMTAKWWGTVTSVVVGGIGTVLVVIAVTLIWPQVMKFGSLIHAKPETEEPKPGA